MITLIIPTRNRAHTLRRVLPSYFNQESVTEIIVVIDNGTDATADLVANYSIDYPDISVIIVQNQKREGASESRNVGVSLSTNEYILFCDDDEYLEANYATICLEKLLAADVGAVSGRRVYMHGEESPEEAVKRFGNGLRSSPPFRPALCEYVNGARYIGDIELPFTNAIILTRRALLLAFPFDKKYAKGNGYREETDFQMNLYVNGYKIIATNDVHSIHLPLNQVRSGGQRGSRFKRIAWSIYYTNYFYSKYYVRYATKVGLSTPKILAVLNFSIFVLYRELIRPPLYAVWVWSKFR